MAANCAVRLAHSAAAGPGILEPHMPGSLIGRIGASLPSILIGLALVIGLWLLPDLTPSEAIPVVGQHSEHARIVEARGTDSTGLPSFLVELEDGEQIEAVVQDASAAVPGSSTRPPYEIGDEVVVTVFTGPAAGDFAVIAEPWRVPILGVVTAVFAAAVIVVGGLRGARSLVALALTLTFVIKVVVPAPAPRLRSDPPRRRRRGARDRGDPAPDGGLEPRHLVRGARLPGSRSA